ncbi:MAG: hypothetical protein UU87_C0003G0204 [Parcubacteria group bacterium GW2011_GWA2_42_11]|nr:MAG: hypothetical protein UU87_C0003G0204 [Parcubacteria group bacterium GW2011_GWA2_42_11]KKT76534.1 MAG: hypothetical protein UW72_C0005G0102 [Parcubacteria group bacterium GW2011_GWF2_44_7]
MKTINELNSKAWYRLLKVFFILVFIFIIVAYVEMISTKMMDNINLEKSTIKCESGNKETSLKDAGILPSIYYIDSHTDYLIRTRCGKIKFIPSENKFSNIINNEGDYSVDLIYYNDWIGMIVRITIFIILLSAIFEIIRRIFYYIALGKINPSEKNLFKKFMKK